MTPLLVGFLIVILLPLFMATWRSNLLALALQGFFLGLIALEHEPSMSATTSIVLIDMFILRALVAPLALYEVMRRHNAPRRQNVLPTNLLFWALAGGLVLVAFHFAYRLAPDDDALAFHLSVATAGVLLALVILAGEGSTFSQVVGVLRLENAIALFELASGSHLQPVLQGGIAFVFLSTVLTVSWLLNRLGLASASEEAVASPLRATL